jgi:hypothetical protein
MAFCGFQFPSVFVNHGDIAPNYAGTIFGITNTGASIPGIIAPYVVASITVNVSFTDIYHALNPSYFNVENYPLIS